MPIVGEIRVFAGANAPAGWAKCHGQFLAISQNNALFTVLGTRFGGDGRTTFRLPDLQGRVPVCTGQGPGLSPYTLGQTGGEETHTLTAAELGQHYHNVLAVPASSTVPTGNRPGPNQFLAASSAKDTDGSVLTFNLYTLDEKPMTTMDSHIINDGPAAPHENRMPSLTLNYCLALQGIFP